MIAEEKLIAKINNLPAAEIDEVIDFVDFLLYKNGIGENGSKQKTPQERADAIKLWATGHSIETPVVFDDRREIIYED
ncbi:MAG: DUF2281 domain-containing protein [Pyrinomonadaceae bacterium]